MIFRAKPPIRRTGRGVEIHLSAEERELLRSLVADHRRLLEGSADDPEMRRLFPTAYPDDPQRDAEYQILARSELVDSRFTALDIVASTLDAEVLDDDQLNAWLHTVNQLRLVLGTRLDISEDEDDIDPRSDDAGERILYQYLTMVMSLLVDATGF